MGTGRRKLKQPDDYDQLETDDAGNLFWKGNKVKMAGWGAAVWAVIIAVGAFLVSFLANYDNIEATLKRLAVEMGIM